VNAGKQPDLEEQSLTTEAKSDHVTKAYSDAELTEKLCINNT
jgi:hypothetical protein